MFTNSPPIAENDAPSKAPIQDAQQPLRAEALNLFGSTSKFNATPTLGKAVKSDTAGQILGALDLAEAKLIGGTPTPISPKLADIPQKTSASPVQDGKGYLVLTDAFKDAAKSTNTYSDTAKLAADKKLFA